mgnify:CR=1 FL=1
MAEASSGAIVTQGTKLYRWSDAGNGGWDRVRGVSSFSGPNTSKSKIDVTSFDSNRKEYIYGIPDEGDISFTMFFYPSDPVHKAIIKEDIPSAYNRAWRLELSDGTIYEFEGNLSSAPLTGNMDAAVTWNMTLSVSGSAEWRFANDLAALTWDNDLVGNKSTGAVTGSVTITLDSMEGEEVTFTDAVSNSSAFAPEHYSIANVPAGLTAKLTKTSATVATLTFTGASTDKIDVTDIALTFKSAAFKDISAYAVSGYSKNNIAITFAAA